MKKEEQMSFRDLLAQVAPTVGENLPKAKQILKSGTPLIVLECGDATITVFTNGFYTYTKDDKTTVFAVDRCMGFPSEYDAIPEDQYMDLPFVYVLTIMGEKRLEENQDDREQYKIDFSMSGSNRDYDQAAIVEDFADSVIEEMEKREKIKYLYKAMKELTDHQRKIIKMYYYDEMLEEEIARELGISRQAVSNILRKSIKKMKKFFQKVVAQLC